MNPGSQPLEVPDREKISSGSRVNRVRSSHGASVGNLVRPRHDSEQRINSLTQLFPRRRHQVFSVPALFVLFCLCAALEQREERGGEEKETKHKHQSSSSKRTYTHTHTHYAAAPGSASFSANSGSLNAPAVFPRAPDKRERTNTSKKEETFSRHPPGFTHTNTHTRLGQDVFLLLISF